MIPLQHKNLDFWRKERDTKFFCLKKGHKINVIKQK
jgi:hypothetical protein